jgi:uncharacterized protein (DUF433 family)
VSGGKGQHLLESIAGRNRKQDGKTIPMDYRDRIVRDPHIVGGEPVLKGTRVTLRTVLASLAEGASTAEILSDFPTLSEEDVRARLRSPQLPPKRTFLYPSCRSDSDDQTRRESS